MSHPVLRKNLAWCGIGEGVSLHTLTLYPPRNDEFRVGMPDGDSATLFLNPCEPARIFTLAKVDTENGIVFAWVREL